MAEYVEYTPELFDVVRAYFEAAGERSDAAYSHWLLNQIPRNTMMVALVDGRCAAIVSALHKDYWVRGRSMECLEPYGWSTSTEFRGRGLGAEVMKRLMALGKPMFAVGGSADTARLLPKLGWITTGHVPVFALPRSGRWLRQKLESRGRVVSELGGVAFGLGGRLAFHTSRPRRNSRWESVPLTSFDPSATDLYPASSFHEVVAPADARALDWAERFPRPGQYLHFEFREDGQRRAFGVARVIISKEGVTGDIVDVFAARPDVEIYWRALREMAATLDGFGVDGIVANASCPVLQQALKASRFIPGHSHPLRIFWPASCGPFPKGPVHIVRGSADQLFRPGLPTS